MSDVQFVEALARDIYTQLAVDEVRSIRSGEDGESFRRLAGVAYDAALRLEEEFASRRSPDLSILTAEGRAKYERTGVMPSTSAVHA